MNGTPNTKNRQKIKSRIRNRVNKFDLNNDLFEVAKALYELMQLEEFPTKEFLKWAKNEKKH
jgi:hypothetical protein